MSAEKTLEILDLFTFETRELNVRQIAEMLEQPQSSVYRHLRVLKEKGYVIENNGGFYKLGYRFLELAKIVKTDISISSIAFPIMQKLTYETEETSILTIASGLHAVCLEVITTPQPIKVSSAQGRISPIYAGASSRILLAYMPSTTVDELVNQGLLKGFTPNTIVDPEKLKESLEGTRQRGYAVSDSEVDEGVVAYGVPIRDMDNQVVAALSIAGPRERMLKKNEQKLIDTLLSATNEIQKYL
ncbi:IclR family transcriptional regulator [Bacillus sp. EB600]|uniref:IclR family transcriptional regulator n=1 Tax=Bacillus sp. EB600 TaxID=2806345 RepID=UPI00210C1C2A|nr:IclR family transcriptional regulator [Bacillus sp. EB600]MCQ6278493.1 IclR family transcriptional regulator [Bacillus sp. EB600]